MTANRRPSAAAPTPSLTDRFWHLVYRIVFPVRRVVVRVLGWGNAGTVVAIRTESDLIVIRHSYRAGVDFPGGGLHAGEAPASGAVREVEEELGLTVAAEALRPLGRTRRPFKGAGNRDHLFEWRTEEPLTLVPDGREVVWAGTLRDAACCRSELSVPVRWYLRRHAPELRRHLC